MSSTKPLAQSVVAPISELFGDFGLQVVQAVQYSDFSNWAILLESSELRARVYTDRGDVFSAIGPSWNEHDWNSGPWFAIEEIVDYLKIPAPPFPVGIHMGKARIEWYSQVLRSSWAVVVAEMRRIEREPNAFNEFRQGRINRLLRR